MHTVALIIGVAIILVSGGALIMGLSIRANAWRALQKQGVPAHMPLTPDVIVSLMVHMAGVTGGSVSAVWGWAG
jgi:hypothetical protein